MSELLYKLTEDHIIQKMDHLVQIIHYELKQFPRLNVTLSNERIAETIFDVYFENIPQLNKFNLSDIYTKIIQHSIKLIVSDILNSGEIDLSTAINLQNYQNNIFNVQFDSFSTLLENSNHISHDVKIGDFSEIKDVDKIPQSIVLYKDSITNTDFNRISKEITFNLIDPVIIANKSQIFLDTISFTSAKGNTFSATDENNSIFIIDVLSHQFTHFKGQQSNSEKLHGKITVPNSSSSTKNICKVLKDKKFNYLGYTHPTKLHSFKLNITTLDDAVIWDQNGGDSNCSIYLEFYIKPI